VARYVESAGPMAAFLNSNTNKTLPYQGWDLNFRARFMKNVFFLTEKDKIRK